MSPIPDPWLKPKSGLFFFWLSLVVLFFFWSRLDFSNHIYYFGDGNVVVELIRLILTTHDWNPNWARLSDIATPQAELLPFIEMPKSTDHFYHMSGYIILSAIICKIIYSLGFSEIPIQTILHVLNIFFQAFTLLLLFMIGKRLANRYVGLLTATFFALFPLAVMEGHYERPESWMTLLATGIAYCGLQFSKSPIRYSICIGTLIGLSVATKLSQLFLALIPGIIFLHLWLDSQIKNLAQRTINIFTLGIILCLSVIFAIAINTPFILTNLAATLDGVKSMAAFYATPTYPYAEEHYNYLSQLLVTIRYFWFTLGTTWCLLFIIGTSALLKNYFSRHESNRYVHLLLIAPVLLFIFYSAFQINFIERNFSSLEGLISLISAYGFYTVAKLILKRKVHATIKITVCLALTLSIIYTPMRLNIAFVQNYIKNPDLPPRILFQNILKHDFQNFWVKNVYFTLKLNHELPEKPPKAPRLYQVDDLNEYWTRDYLLVLEKNGFRKVGTYCSEFSSLPPNTLTLYHAAAKNHYFVRDDEWPATLPRDYFKTNCT